MHKLFIFAIISLSILTSCSFNNPLSKKANLVYLDCPKSLILAPGKSLTKDKVNISLKRNYSINCYSSDDALNEVIIDFNYQLDINTSNIEPIKTNVDLWIFLTNKEESKKISEYSFNKSFDLPKSTEENKKLTLEFNDKIVLKKSEYDQGVKIFLSLN